MLSFAMADHPQAHRGAPSNPDGRFERHCREEVDDGWWRDDDLPPLKTTLEPDRARSVITRNQSPDIPFDRSINPYRGCEHGCIYCYARPTHAYLGLSPGLDFETRLFAKPEAGALLDQELRHPGYRCQPIAIGTNTDPYQPVERQAAIMRAILTVLAAFAHPVTITTKSALILRDRDILTDLARRRLVSVTVSITTLDRDLARRLEPRAAVPAARLATLQALAEAGIPVAVNVAPVIPGLTDPELETILEAAVKHGATAASWLLLRLPYEVGDLFTDWLALHAPHRRDRVLSLLRQCRGGRLNDPRFGHRFAAQGPFAAMLRDRFRIASRKLGLADRPILRTDLFRLPPRPGDQLSLFG